MKILYWNVCNEADPAAITSEVIDLIETEKIGVACLQEIPYVHSIPLISTIASELAMGATSNSEWQWDFEHTRTLKESATDIKGYGTAVLTNLGIHNTETRTLRNDSLAYMTPGRDNHRALVSLQTKERPDISIGVAHLSYPLPFRIGNQGMKRERVLLRRKLENQLNDGELVFGGDMNIRPDGELDEILGSIGLRNIVDTTQPTFRSRHWFAGHIKRNLDRVFVSPGIEASSTIVERRQSDHNPIIVDISR